MATTPEAVVRPRFDCSIRNFLLRCRLLGDSWMFFGNAGAAPAVINHDETAGKVLNLPLEERAEMELKAAVEKVIVEHARQGLSIYIWRDSRVVEATPEELRAQAILLSTESA